MYSGNLHLFYKMFTDYLYTYIRVFVLHTYKHKSLGLFCGEDEVIMLFPSLPPLLSEWGEWSGGINSGKFNNPATRPPDTADAEGGRGGEPTWWWLSLLWGIDPFISCLFHFTTICEVEREVLSNRIEFFPFFCRRKKLLWIKGFNWFLNA